MKISLKDVLSPDVLSLWTFCPLRRLVCRTCCPYGRFVSIHVLYLRSITTKLILLDSLLQEVVHVAPPRVSDSTPGAHGYKYGCIREQKHGTKQGHLDLPGVRQETREWLLRPVRCLRAMDPQNLWKHL